MIAHPVWSTWAKFKMAVNQTLVLSYAHDIVDHGFNCSQVEIDDRWSPYYGELRVLRTHSSQMHLVTLHSAVVVTLAPFNAAQVT